MQQDQPSPAHGASREAQSGGTRVGIVGASGFTGAELLRLLANHPEFEVVAATGAPLRELRRVMTEYPQVLRNVRVRVKERLPDATAVWDAVATMEKRLGDDGRVLVRASGTESLVRVMVEAIEASQAAAIADDLVMLVRRELGGETPEPG